jgi:D-arabinose 1-dehydrogenase-like Zn-dependent alcohol dehydrogenase
MPNQAALALTAIGKPLEILTLPIPDVSELKENEILIKITAAGSTFNNINSIFTINN